MELTDKQTQAQQELQNRAKKELARRHLLDFIKYRFPSYKTNWHHVVLANALERVKKGELKRLMVFMPPRHGKSEEVSAINSFLESFLIFTFLLGYLTTEDITALCNTGSRSGSISYLIGLS